MPTPPVTDAYIDSVINANDLYNPNLNKTQGVQLRALVKTLRDSLEQEIADSAALLAPLDSPSFTGNPTAPTQPTNDVSLLLANTAFVDHAITSRALTGVDNGLSAIVRGSGTHLVRFIEMGGPLNAATNIDAGTIYPFKVGNITGSAALISVDPANAQAQVIGGASQLNLQQDNVELLMASATYGANKSILMNDAAITVADNINHKGFENAGDYEANFTARSLVTKQYVDGVSPGLPTGVNGLNGSSNIGLGGLLTSWTTIGVASYLLNLGDPSLETAYIQIQGNNHVGMQGGGTSGSYAFLNLNGANANLSFTDSGGVSNNFNIGESLLINDNISNKGLSYGTDYSANFTARSLIDKGYADATYISGDTITSKRITKRVLALSANSATPAVNTDNYDVVHITGQSATIIGFAMSGTPVDGDMFRISITGTASVPFVLGSSFEPSGGVALSTTTNGTNRLDMGFVWNTETSKWRQIAVA